LRARICAVFGAYTFKDIDDLCTDEFAELAGAVLWLSEQEARAVRKSSGKGRRR